MRDSMMDRLAAMERENAALRAEFKILKQFLVKEFPKHFAGDIALGIAQDGESLGGEKLPDIHPIDLRTEAEIARGECFHLTDFVTMDSLVG